jgi:hypothetical protein
LERVRTAGIIFPQQPSAFKRYSSWGRASRSAPAYPGFLGEALDKPQMLPGYSKSAIGYAHGRWTLTGEFLMFEWVAWLRC